MLCKDVLMDNVQSDGQPKNMMPPTYCCWWRHKNIKICHLCRQLLAMETSE